MNNCILIICPPHSDYPQPPEDYSKSELRDCSKCNSKMWLSEKKKGFMLFHACLGKKIIFACYHCMTKMAQENPSMLRDSQKINL